MHGFWNMVRYEYIRHLGYYCTESSEHNAEYNPWFIKSRYPEMIEEFNIPLDEYPRRCINQIEGWGERAGGYPERRQDHPRAKQGIRFLYYGSCRDQPALQDRRKCTQ